MIHERRRGVDMKLSIVIPVYNEENYIDAVIERVLAVPFPK